MRTLMLLAATLAAMTPAHASAQTPARPAEGQRVVLITGSTDGLGREVARRIAGTGAHVIVHGRNRERGQAVVDEITRAGKGSARFYAADFANLDQVRTFAAEIARDYPRIDVLVNNAGIWNTSNSREVSADGHELHFAVNYLAGYALTRALLPAIRKGTSPRIINVASVAQTPIDFSDVMLERGYTGSRGYGQSKLAQIIFTMDLADELRGQVTVLALHPATLMNTSMVAEAGIAPRATVEQGADAVMQLITAPALETGEYYNGNRAARANAQAYDAAARTQLRELSERLINLREPGERLRK